MVQMNLILVLLVSAAPPEPPTNCKALPDYELSKIRVEWEDKSNNETAFEIYRRVDTELFALLDTVSANTESYWDEDVDPSHEYRYKVRAINNDGPSAYTDFVRQNLKVIWPVPASHEILHNWQDTIGVFGINTNVQPSIPCGFHQGVDFQNLGSPNNTVKVIRGGEVARVEDDPQDNGLVVIRVLGNGVWQRESYQHLKTGLEIEVNTTVFSGQVMGAIGADHFPTALADHLHLTFQDAQGVERPWHPLQIFSQNANRDPLQRLPELKDHPETPPTPPGTWLFQSQGAQLDVYLPYDATHPLDGDVDIIAELADELGMNPDQVPVKLGYWIESPTGSGCSSIPFFDIKSASAPYVLFDFEQQDFCAAPDALELSKKIVDYARNLGPSIVENNEIYLWDNYKHFIVTNTIGTDGSPESVDGNMHWNTNAKDDGSAETGVLANFAGKGDTIKAREARFPDGVYTIHVLASDLIHSDVDLTTTVRIENFCPIVCTATPTGELPCGTVAASGSVTFNEPMDTGVNPSTIISVNNAATISNAQWATNQLITFTITGLVDGAIYTITVEGSNAKDQPGTPGNRLLDGNEDGACGDDDSYQFSVGIVGTCCAPFIPTGTGACCLQDGTCIETCEAGCEAAGGQFWAASCGSDICCESPQQDCVDVSGCDGYDDEICLCVAVAGTEVGYCLNNEWCANVQACQDGVCPAGCVCSLETCCPQEGGVCACRPCDGSGTGPPPEGSSAGGTLTGES